nr:hypothetical protein [Candidatus Dormibacteraeota bacterium]
AQAAEPLRPCSFPCGELMSDPKRIRGKAGIFFKLAEAAVDHPDETVRRALYPVVGEGTLRALVREARANQAAFRQRVRTVLRSSYSAHYRRMLLPLLQFRSNNSAYGKYNDLVATVAIQNVIDLTRAVRQLIREGYTVMREDRPGSSEPLPNPAHQTLRRLHPDAEHP